MPAGQEELVSDPIGEPGEFAGIGSCWHGAPRPPFRLGSDGMLELVCSTSARRATDATRHHHQLFFDFVRLWPGAGMPPSA